MQLSSETPLTVSGQQAAGDEERQNPNPKPKTDQQEEGQQRQPITGTAVLAGPSHCGPPHLLLSLCAARAALLNVAGFTGSHLLVSVCSLCRFLPRVKAVFFILKCFTKLFVKY